MTPRRLLGELPVTAVLGVGAVGFVIVAQGFWRRGLLVIAASLLLAALLRLALPTRRAGLLAVRSKVVDVVMLGGFGSAMLLLAAVVPRPR